MGAEAATAAAPLDREAIGERVRAIVVEELGASPEEVKPAAKLADDLKADSLDQVALVMEIEDAFGVEIPDDEAEAIETVEDIVDLIEKRLAA